MAEDAPGEDDELPGGGGDDSLAVLQLRVQPCWQGELQLQKTDHLPELLVREPPQRVQAEPEGAAEQRGVLVTRTRQTDIPTTACTTSQQMGPFSVLME